MRHTLFITLLFALAATCQAQVVISDTRPAASTTLAPLPECVDTVFLVLNNQVITGLRKEVAYKCIYEQTGRHEGNVFAGNAVFFGPDQRGSLTVPVKPTAWRYKKAIFSSERPWEVVIPEPDPVRQ
jgi:hypothetical protein